MRCPPSSSQRSSTPGMGGGLGKGIIRGRNIQPNGAGWRPNNRYRLCRFCYEGTCLGPLILLCSEVGTAGPRGGGRDDASFEHFAHAALQSRWAERLLEEADAGADVG